MRVRVWLIAAAGVAVILLNAHLLSSRVSAAEGPPGLLFEGSLAATRPSGRVRPAALHVDQQLASSSSGDGSGARVAAAAAAPPPLLAAGAATAAPAADTAPSANCPPGRAPYHVLLTASSGNYQRWQTRVFYHHYTRLKAAHPCSDIGGFTRLLTLPDSRRREDEDAGLSQVMTTLVARELTKGTEDLGFVVLNRPTSVAAVLASGELEARLAPDERHLFIVETDHVFLKPLPNLLAAATGGEEAAAYPFHYMNPTRDAGTIAIVRRHAGSDEAAKRVQQARPALPGPCEKKAWG